MTCAGVTTGVWSSPKLFLGDFVQGAHDHSKQEALSVLQRAVHDVNQVHPCLKPAPICNLRSYKFYQKTENAKTGKSQQISGSALFLKQKMNLINIGYTLALIIIFSLFYCYIQENKTKHSFHIAD